MKPDQLTPITSLSPLHCGMQITNNTTYERPQSINTQYLNRKLARMWRYRFNLCHILYRLGFDATPSFGARINCWLTEMIIMLWRRRFLNRIAWPLLIRLMWWIEESFCFSYVKLFVSTVLIGDWVIKRKCVFGKFPFSQCSLREQW